MLVQPVLNEVGKEAATLETPSNSQRTRFGDISRTNRTASLMRVFTQAVASAQSGLSHLEEGKFRRFGELDLQWLSFAQLDFVAEQTEFSAGIERDRVVSGVLPQAREQAKALGCFGELGDEGLKRGLELLFDSLCNRGERYKAFKVPMWDAELQRFITRKFWLLKTVAIDGERTELGNGLFELTDEAYMLLFGLMEQDALDLARINVLRMEMLLSRGAFGEAVSLADNNARQAQRLTSEIRTLRRQIIRSISSVAIERVEYLGSEGIYQVDKLQNDLGSLGTLVRKYLDTLTDTNQLRQLSMLKEKLDAQRKATINLQTQIMDLPDTFRQQQHKLFRRRAHMEGRRLPPLEQAIKPLAILPFADINRVADEFLARFSYPVAVELFDPGSLLQQFNRVLERNERSEIDTIVEDEEVELLEEFVSQLTPQMVASVRQWMRVVIPAEGALLSTLIERALVEHDSDTAVAVQGIAIVSLDPQNDEEMSVLFRFRASPTAERYSIVLGDGRRAHGHDLHLSVQLNFKDQTQ
ncbi:hypothetical protein ACOMICROBIO_NCLOACGD_02450 [Vibrio sp. B1ASS3]|nr:hypothetical protein ACOMICROBIO_NCLOACGD_02450 [Vibrio sp. B1ASS3]CAE6916105.1 hypothetical protein ACOMICROBIO_NCLOACGD_02450 [Vibrio sp. B1ASS3]